MLAGSAVFAACAGGVCDLHLGEVRLLGHVLLGPKCFHGIVRALAASARIC